MPTRSIRQATEADLESMLALYHEFHEFHVHGVPDRLQVPDHYDDTAAGTLLTSLLHDPRAALFVAYEQGVLIGLAEVYLRCDTPNPAAVAYQYGYLQSLVVTGSARRQGLGRELLAVAERWSRDLGATELRLNCWEFAAGPLSFYEACGYRTIKRTLTRPLT
jgi:GNAT superfamily N-acetyltransferase